MRMPAPATSRSKRKPFQPTSSLDFTIVDCMDCSMHSAESAGQGIRLISSHRDFFLDFTSHKRRYFGTKKLNRVHSHPVWQRRDAHLERQSRDSTEYLITGEDPFHHSLQIAHQECSCRAANSFKLAPRHRWPAAFLADLGERLCITRKEFIGGLLVCVGNISEGMNTDAQALKRVSCLLRLLAV